MSRYLKDTDLLVRFENEIENKINSINKIEDIENQERLQLFIDNLNVFLTNTESDTTITLYHVKIIDSMNSIIHYSFKYEAKGYEDKNDYFIDKMTPKNVLDEKKQNNTSVNIPTLSFANLPERSLKFDTWKQLHDWTQIEVKKWEHWYDYISEVNKDVKPAMNIQRGAMVRLLINAQNILSKKDNIIDLKRFSRRIEKTVNEVNESNPIVSYSKLGKEMISAMDDNPDDALEKYQNQFLMLLKDNKVTKVQSTQKETNPNESEFINKEIEESLKQLGTIDLKNHKNSLEKLKKYDLEQVQESVAKLKKIDLKTLYNKFKNNPGILNENLFKSLEQVKDLDLEDYEKRLNSVMKMDLDEHLDLTKKIEIDNIKNEPITDVSEIKDENIIEQYNLIIKEYKEKNFGKAFNNIQKEKDKIDKVIIDLENQLKDVIKSNDIPKLNEIEVNLNKYKNIKKEYHCIVIDALHKTTNGRLNEEEIISFIVDFLIDLNYPKENILTEKNTDDLNTYISIKYLNTILIIIQVKKLKDKNSTDMYNSLYRDVLKKQNNKPVLYIVDPADSIYSFYEYDINTNEYSKIALVPSFKQLIKSIDAESDIYPHLDNDTPDENTKDSLSISNDVDAFAKLISYKGLTPPLSVGLFGEWGSGKSFFMKELEHKINDLSNKKDETFIKNILHIRFNAWHYSDTNLWASLIYKIFSEINNEITDPASNPNEVEKNKLFKELKSVQEAIKYKENEKSDITEKLTKLTEDKDNLEIKINDDIENIKTLKFQDYYKLILEEKNIQSDLNDIKDKLLLDNI